MQFSIGDKIVHPYRGPGRIVDVEERDSPEGLKRYYVIEMSVQGMTLHVPVKRASELGMRAAMRREGVTRVLDILRSRPGQLSRDYKERQEVVWEKIRTGRPVLTAEAVRDLTWRRHMAHLTKTDTELLQRGQGFLAAEMALVSDSKVAEAEKTIESVLAAAIEAMEKRLPQQPAQAA